MNINNINRKIFGKSFLKNIQSAYTFEQVGWTDSIKKSIIELLKNNEFEIANTGDIPAVQAKKNTIISIISSNRVILSMDIRDYVCFDEYIKYIEMVCQIFNILGCKELKNFIFQKENYYKLEKSQDIDTSQNAVFKALFTDKVLLNPSDCISENNNCFFMVQPSYKEDENHVIAKLVISTLSTHSLPKDNLIEELTQVNNTMYQLWYEATTEGVHKIMDVQET